MKSAFPVSLHTYTDDIFTSLRYLKIVKWHKHIGFDILRTPVFRAARNLIKFNRFICKK